MPNDNSSTVPTLEPIAEQTATSTTDGKKEGSQEQLPQPTEVVKETLPQPTAEELEWNKLSGPVQKRVRSLVETKNALLEEVQTLKTRPAYVPDAPNIPAVSEEQLSSEQQLAVANLKKMTGFITEAELQQIKDQITLETEYSKLESRFSGDDGKPVFDRAEVERHMRDTGIYNPEKAYEDLYKDELFDWRLKQKSSHSDTPKQVFSERPSSSTASKTEPLTVDGLRQRLAQPDGREWWDKNRERILPMIGSLLQG